MKKQTAWNGFYKAVKEIKEIDREMDLSGYNGRLSDKRKMANMRAKKYCKSLVFEHGWQDIHTNEYFVRGVK